MAYRKIPLDSLVVNPANDRHGELENETAAIAQLFAMRETHMRNLARDIVEKGEILEPPLVYQDGGKFIVADGNRRTTCLKLLQSPQRAPTTELQSYFEYLRGKWSGAFPDQIECRVEPDRDRVDEILFRRHTGVQGGIGQSTWNDRMKNHFVIRTGQSRGFNVADEIEKRLKEANLLPEKKIPRSNLNRLLSSEAIRNRVGISVKKGKLSIIRDERETISTLNRVASDLAYGKTALDKIWDSKSKHEYINTLEAEGALPSPARHPSAASSAPNTTTEKPQPPSPRPKQWPHLIPNVDYGIAWVAETQRHRAIWEELQHHIEVNKMPNAAAVLLRVLLEISTDYHNTRQNVSGVTSDDRLPKKVGAALDNMLAKGTIDKSYKLSLEKLRQREEIVSIDTLNKYVHSPNFSVSTQHLKVMWETLSNYICLCLNAPKA